MKNLWLLMVFINGADDSEVRVEARMLRNKPGELIFSNPGLPVGTYRLEVRSVMYRTSDVRTGTLGDELIVAGAG